MFWKTDCIVIEAVSAPGEVEEVPDMPGMSMSMWAMVGGLGGCDVFG
jgi:hypothetical protein